MRRGFYPTVSPRRYQSSRSKFLEKVLAKRLFDIAFSLSVLVLCSPLYLAIALMIAVSSPGPIFYVQERVGRRFKRFKCIKFRTMVTNADEILEALMADCPQTREEFESNFKLRDDPRITWIGKFLRLTSLDEFPQFWNVLKGDMSLVGPRPLIPDELQKYGRQINQVLSIKPGLTGLWQVSGRNDIPYPERVQIDVYYVHYRTMTLDLLIIAKTLGVMLFPNNNGAY
jgi:lipopolysaccharide/colanic/teichoic acid biosynthesis glycosyltransferase